MSSRVDAIMGFSVAGIAILFIAKWQPQLALGITGLVALGVALSHPDELTGLYNAFASAAHPF